MSKACSRIPTFRSAKDPATPLARPTLKPPGTTATAAPTLAPKDPHKQDASSGPYSIIFLKQDGGPEDKRSFPQSGDDDRSQSNDPVKRRRVGEKPTTLFLLNSTTAANNTAPPKIPTTPDFEENLLKKLQLNLDCAEDACSKRDSLELDESSLGILTPEQMIDGLKISSNPPSPEVTDLSLGIIDEQILMNLTARSDTTMNMELPLDPNSSANKRLEQTPSPEDLPLDPPAISTTSGSSDKSKVTNFVTSITSITSLDTGYQGDGEMSRPASRGADNSPLTRRPLPRLTQTTRRQDPMTDSDFYTESDADNHDYDNPLRGDRRAQVIDGTLYGVDPQAAADIYVNNRENMDSSGVFTDLENTRNEEEEVVDVSPSDSTKTISGNSQNLINNNDVTPKDDSTGTNSNNSKKRGAPSPVTSSPSSRRSPINNKNSQDAVKKYKIPKRDLSSNSLNNNKNLVKKSVVAVDKKSRSLDIDEEGVGKKSTAIMNKNNSSNSKKIGRWDAVMNKIGKSDQKTNLKEVKSRVFNTLNVAPRHQNLNHQVKTTNNKLRRTRARPTPASVHSSLSDLSSTGAVPKCIVGSKKQDQVQVTQVLTASKLSLPRTPGTPPSKVKISTPKLSPRDANSKSKPLKRTLLGTKEEGRHNRKSTAVNNNINKECARAALNKGGRASPVVVNRGTPINNTITPQIAPPRPVPQVQNKTAPLVAEALAVLVQHLVFNVEAFRVPLLKQELDKASRLINTLKSDNDEKLVTLKSEFERLQKTHNESVDILREENDAIREQIDEKNLQIEEIRHESAKLRLDYEAKESKLSQDNVDLRSAVDDHEDKVRCLRVELSNAKSETSRLRSELSRLEDEKRCVVEDNSRLKEENERLMSFGGSGDNKEISFQELQSLRVVLELKQNEVSELRRALAEEAQRNEVLAGAEEKALVFGARCEDLQLQLQRKTECELTLIAENKKLQDNFKEEVNQRQRLQQYNEELQWKLRQNKEIVSKVLEQAAEETSFNRSLLTASFNERHCVTPQHLPPNTHLERTLSFREPRRTSPKIHESGGESSPPTSPKVKGVVEKSDWVSYVLDLDESPEIVASRIVRRSFRNSTPPKTTPTKCIAPSSRRGYKNPLSQSASASAILPGTTLPTPNKLSRSLPHNGEGDNVITWRRGGKNNCDDDEVDLDLEAEEEEEVDLDDLRLPALPSEIGRRKNGHLPSPKHLASDDAIVSESNSEDESTSSSSAQL